MRCELIFCLRECEGGHYDAMPMCTVCYIIERLLYNDLGIVDDMFVTSTYVKDRCAAVDRSVK